MICYHSRPKVPFNLIRTCPTCGYFLNTYHDIPQRDIIELVDKDVICTNCSGGTIRASGVCAWNDLVQPINANTFNLGSNLLSIQDAYLDNESRLICSCDKTKIGYSVMSCDYRHPFVCTECGYLLMMNTFKDLSDDVSKLMSLLYQAQVAYIYTMDTIIVDLIRKTTRVYKSLKNRLEHV